MKRAILAAITCCAMTGVVIGASTPPPKKAVTPTKKSPPVASKKGAAPPAAHPSTATNRTPTPAKTPPKPLTNRTTSNNRVASKRYYSRPPVRRTYSPQQPTNDRYREIQDALAAKGYLKTPSTGVWDKDSMDAMTRFQKDQQLDATGKLTAKSLAALGLGSKTASAAGPAVEPSGSLSANPASEATQLQ